MMDSDIFKWALLFMPTVLFTLAVHTRSLGVNRAAIALGISGLGLVAIALGTELSPKRASEQMASISVWGAAAVVPALACFDVWRSRWTRADFRGVSRIPFVASALGATATFSVIMACCVALQAMGWFILCAVLWCLLVWLTLGVSSLFIAKNMDHGGGDRAWAARLYSLWSLAVILLPFAAFSGSKEVLAVALAACFAFPVASPFVALYLVGIGPVPRDLRWGYDGHYLEDVVLDPPGDATPVPVAPRPRSDASRRLVLAFWFVLAAGAVVVLLTQHLSRCRGQLAPVKTSIDWRALPVLAEYGDGGKIGPFNFRAQHHNYKGYPAPYYDAAISDPGLCFASSIPIVSWFGDDMYRSPAELRLRESRENRVFFISAQRGNEGEILLAAFERRWSTQLQFDTEGASSVFVLGALFLLLGSCCALQWLRLSPEGKESSRGGGLRGVAVACFVITTSATFLFQSHWASDTTPKPGRELAVENAWLI